MTATDSLGLIRACFTAQGGRGASFRYNRRMAPDITATGLFSDRRQKRYSSSNRLARPVKNLKPSSTDNSETPRLCRAFLLASTCVCRRQYRRFPSGAHHAACMFSLLDRRRRNSVADQLPATSMRAQSAWSVYSSTSAVTSAQRHALCVPHRIAQDIEPEVPLPIGAPRPGAAQRPARLF